MSTKIHNPKQIKQAIDMNLVHLKGVNLRSKLTRKQKEALEEF